MSESYPRVLIVSGYAFGQHSATAITMTNLFWRWPLDRIALVYGEDVEPDPDVCRRCWRLMPEDVPVDRLVRRMLGRQKDRILGQQAPGLPSGLGVSSGGNASPYRVSLRGVASAWADILPCHPPIAFWNWADDFRPDVIYSMLGSIRLMGLVLRVAKRCRAVIVPHFMDDWPTTHYRGVWKWPPRAIMLSRLRSVLRRSPLGMTIGPAMADEYQRRFGVRFEAFMNCVEVPGEYPAEPVDNADRPLRFLYVGGLHLDRWRALVDVGKGLTRLRSEGRNAELIVHAPPDDRVTYGEALSAVPAIRLGESLSQQQIVPAMRAADVLVHVESFDPLLREYTRFSVSTKMPQYMSCGKPILAYGPEELASCRYVQSCECGIVIGEQDPDVLLAALRALAADARQRAFWGRRGWEAANERHSAEKVRQRFRSALARAADWTGDQAA